MNAYLADLGAERADERVSDLAERAKSLVEARLKHHVEAWGSTSGRLSTAAGQALMAPSKRVRPILLCLFAAEGDRIPQAAVDAGCAIEMVHTASLILDDLPCMDNAATRRSRASTHVAFGQSTAILAAVALLSRAFGLLGSIESVPPQRRVELCDAMASAVGFDGLCAGQDIDVNDRWSFRTTEQIEQLNWLKTGILFSAAAEMGAMIRGVDATRLESIRRFARHVGQAFQIADDLLDRTAGARESGKDVRKDRGFATIVSLLGEAGAQAECAEHIMKGLAALEGSGVAARPVVSYVTKLLAGRVVVTP